MSGPHLEGLQRVLLVWGIKDKKGWGGEVSVIET